MGRDDETTTGAAARGDRHGRRDLDSLLVRQESMRSVLTRVAEVAVDLLGGTDEASVTVVERGRPTSASWTGLLAFELDETQFELDHGPCVEAAATGRSVLIEDMRTEERWPRFTAQAVQQGALSSLSLPIPMQPDLQAALNVYATATERFDPAVHGLLGELTGRAAVAISNMHSYDEALRTVEDLQTAMRSRAMIEQAKGILMGRHGIDAEEAFRMLSSRSQNSNRKLRDLAAELVGETSAPRGTVEDGR